MTKIEQNENDSEARSPRRWRYEGAGAATVEYIAHHNDGGDQDRHTFIIETDQAMVVEGRSTTRLEFTVVGNWECDELLAAFAEMSKRRAAAKAAIPKRDFHTEVARYAVNRDEAERDSAIQHAVDAVKPLFLQLWDAENGGTSTEAALLVIAAKLHDLADAVRELKGGE